MPYGFQPGIGTRKPLQQKPVPPTSYLSGPFSEQAFASAYLGGKIGSKL